MDQMEQYQTSVRLNTRISLHAKYSTNTMGFGNWIVSQYENFTGKRVLELGCGTAVGWKPYPDRITACELFVASDLSEGMLEAARVNLPECSTVQYRRIDIQEIPYESESFDVVLAHMMLYHVPDLTKALGEVKRVLKPGGRFLCATYGSNGILAFLEEVLKDFGVKGTLNQNFTLQNGGEYLRPFFEAVQRRDYEDALAITDVEDMVDYVLSCGSLSHTDRLNREMLRTILEAKRENGVLHIPKEYGMFVCQKAVAP